MKTKIFNRIFALILAVSVVALSFIVPSSAAEGICGPDLDWSLNESTGELVITGNGEMYSYSEAKNVPWYSHSDKITKITVSEGVTVIGRYVFSSCSNATEITLSEGIEEIKYGAFDNCASLESITIPASVEKIDKAPFYFCLKLSSITVADSNENYCSDNGVLYSKDKTELIQYPCAKTNISFTVPSTVTSINTGAFAGCSKLRNVLISESVTTIDSTAFYECSALKSITIPKSVTMIGDKAFSECGAITSVYYTGTQEEWANVSVRNDNENLTDKSFAFETKGPETLPEEATEQATEQTSTTKPSVTKFVSPEQVKEKREIIPLIIIGIAAVVIILIVLLIRVIVKKYPDKDNE